MEDGMIVRKTEKDMSLAQDTELAKERDGMHGQFIYLKILLMFILFQQC